MVMSDDKPNPFEDVRKGLGLLFRAARTTVERLPRKDLEEVVVTSAREVGRAIENVGRTIEREVMGRKSEGTPPPASPPPDPPSQDSADPGKRDDGKPGGPTPPDAA